MGEFVAQLILDSATSLSHDLDLTIQDNDAALKSLPTPMLPHNYETKQDTCYQGRRFQDIVASHVGLAAALM